MADELKIDLPYLLRKNLRSITFDDVVAFLEGGVPEGINIDYKQELNSNSLKKHFAAFSNKYGDIIIVRVAEDKKTGLPVNIKGIDVNAKMVEQINQIASNIDPLPNYEVFKIENSGKGFILIRISEGSEP